MELPRSLGPQRANAAPSPDKRLVAVVVTHDRLPRLKVTLARLLAVPAADLQAVIVVDNVSTDGTAEWLAGQTDARLIVERSPRNVGGAGGFEAGMRLAVRRFDPDWIVVMDDDGRPAPGGIEAFHAADLSGWDAVAAAVYSPDGAICRENSPGHNLFETGRPFHLPDTAYTGAAQQVDMATFVGLFVSRGAIARAGFPDGRLFIYGDDGLYTLGLTRAGGRIGFFPAIRFEHDSTTFHEQVRRFRPLWKTYYYYRNNLLLCHQAAGWAFWPVVAVLVPKWLAKVRHHRGARRPFLHLLWLAFRDGLRGRTDTDHRALLARFPEPGSDGRGERR